jgi:hypothetical protein
MYIYIFLGSKLVDEVFFNKKDKWELGDICLDLMNKYEGKGRILLSRNRITKHKIKLRNRTEKVG